MNLYNGLWGSLMNLAFVRGGFGSKNDCSLIRGRIAMMIWLPGWIGVVLLANWADSVLVGVAGILLLLVGLWLFVYRGDRVAAFLRFQKASKSA